MPASIAQAEKDLLDYIDNNLPSGFVVDQIMQANDGLEKPSDKPWVSPDLRIISEGSTCATGKHTRAICQFVIDIYHPKGTGLIDQSEVMDFYVELLNSKEIGIVKLSTAARSSNKNHPDWLNRDVTVDCTIEG